MKGRLESIIASTVLGITAACAADHHTSQKPTHQESLTPIAYGDEVTSVEIQITSEETPSVVGGYIVVEDSNVFRTHIPSFGEIMHLDDWEEKIPFYFSARLKRDDGSAIELSFPVYIAIDDGEWHYYDIEQRSNKDSPIVSLRTLHEFPLTEGMHFGVAALPIDGLLYVAQINYSVMP